eukprot:Hpha_TRINITY_DN18412_c0_g1::TRINITY_DN18412_c0_g1_i1::g.165553::m.165553
MSSIECMIDVLQGDGKNAALGSTPYLTPTKSYCVMPLRTETAYPVDGHDGGFGVTRYNTVPALKFMRRQPELEEIEGLPMPGEDEDPDSEAAAELVLNAFSTAATRQGGVLIAEELREDLARHRLERGLDLVASRGMAILARAHVLALQEVIRGVVVTREGKNRLTLRRMHIGMQRIKKAETGGRQFLWSDEAAHRHDAEALLQRAVLATRRARGMAADEAVMRRSVQAAEERRRASLALISGDLAMQSPRPYDADPALELLPLLTQPLQPVDKPVRRGMPLMGWRSGGRLRAMDARREALGVAQAAAAERVSQSPRPAGEWGHLLSLTRSDLAHLGVRSDESDVADHLSTLPHRSCQRQRVRKRLPPWPWLRGGQGVGRPTSAQRTSPRRKPRKRGGASMLATMAFAGAPA